MKKTHYLFVVLPCILGCFLYLNTLTHGFAYDDTFFNTEPAYRSLTGIPLALKSSYNSQNPLSGLYRPLPTISFILTYVFFGNSAFSFHAGNILLYGIICSLIYVLLYKTLLFNKQISFLVSILFTVLPIHTEVVANIKSRDELCSILFLILMWMTYEKAQQKHLIWLVVSSFFFFFALLSKETTIVFPFIMIAWTLLRKSFQWKSVISTVSFFGLVSVLYYVIRSMFRIAPLTAQYEVSYDFNPMLFLSPVERLFSSLTILSIYIEKTIIPFSLSASYHFSHFTPISNPFVQWSWVVGCITILLIITVTLWRFSKKDIVVLGSILFVVTYLPISQLLRPGGDAVAERWMFIPSLGLLMMIIGLVYNAISQKKILYIFIFIVLLLYSFITIKRNPVWTNNKTLFTSMTQDAPYSMRGHVLLGNHYLSIEHDFENAKRQADLASAIYPQSSSLNNLQAKLSLIQGDILAAHNYLLESSRIDPTLVETDSLWVQYYYQVGNVEQAYAISQKIIKSGLYRSDDLFAHATLLSKLGKFSEAQEWLLKISEKERSLPEALYLQAVIYYNTGRVKDAVNIKWDVHLTEEERRAEILHF